MQYFLSIFFGTFVLEDVALASALAFVAEGKLDFFGAFMACFLGITIGDLLLYLFGYFVPNSKKNHSPVLTYSILISRIIPGTRLPTYVGAGYMRYPFFKFLGLTVVSVFLWVSLALFAGRSLQVLFVDHWVKALIVFLIGLYFFKAWVPKLLNRWDRRAIFHSWRKWTHFEFWPAWAFYLPIVPYYVFLSVKHKSLLMPFFASPELANGGLIGESKWDTLQYLKPEDPATLKSLKIAKDLNLDQAKTILNAANFIYPFILKPDVGQRGFGVRVIRDDQELADYLLQSDFERIAQTLSHFSCEAGLFYIRKPSQKEGILFSITDKEFPMVTGDGITPLGELILRDKRARIIAPVYFERHRARLDSVLKRGEPFALAECGNHCQGAIFLNGEALATKALLERIEHIAQGIPNFYFGRFDVRYADAPSLKEGKNFEIVEVNGSGAEATHIWDTRTRLIDAYRVLFAQWSLLFEIGAEVCASRGSRPRVPVGQFLRECFKVVSRRERLSVSS